jgi:type IV pilus assembly protein PilA
MKRSQGFTLIELMIVVAIIAILASLAITAYSRSTGKAELSEAFTVADGLKTGVLDYYRQTGSCPSVGTPVGGLASNPSSYSGKYVDHADVTSPDGVCLITATMRSSSVIIPLRNKRVMFTMNSASDSTTIWSCNSDADQIYLPQTCR